MIREIRVAAGTYIPEIGDAAPHYKIYELPKDVMILGGYNAADGSRDVKLNEMILSGNNECLRVVYANVGSAGIDGFTIAKGVPATSR